LRDLEASIRKKMEEMPMLHDIMDHGMIGPAIREFAWWR
jgi:hypothetical protein